MADTSRSLTIGKSWVAIALAKERHQEDRDVRPSSGPYGLSRCCEHAYGGGRGANVAGPGGGTAGVAVRDHLHRSRAGSGRLLAQPAGALPRFAQGRGRARVLRLRADRATQSLRDRRAVADRQGPPGQRRLRREPKASRGPRAAPDRALRRTSAL